MLRIIASLQLLSLCSASPAATVYYVDCASGSDVAGSGESWERAFRSLHHAQATIHAQRGSAESDRARSTVKVTGLCELPTPLVLSAADDNVHWVGEGDGAILSGGTRIKASSEDSSSVQTVDLKPLKFTSANLGTLKGRGYTGGSACILLNNYESSAAELFYRPPGPNSIAGARSSGAEEIGTMRMARYPNVENSVPAVSDWAKIISVNNQTIKIGGTNATLLAGWEAQLKAGGQLFAHGLWSWNWADSHRPVLSVDVAAGSITVGDDDWNHDVNPIKTGHGSAQGGNVYVYGAKSDLDDRGEYIIDHKEVSVSFLPPRAHTRTGPYQDCLWNISLTRSDTPGVWESVTVHADAADSFRFDGCSPTSGPMGAKCSNGTFGYKMKGANALVTTNGTVVGEGVCCNGVTDGVASAVKISCSPPPPPPPPTPAAEQGSFHVSRLDSVVIAQGVTGAMFSNLEIRYARGGGVIVKDSTGVVFDKCTISDHGSMGVNITGGSDCGVQNSNVAGNGNVGVALFGGDRETLTPSGHFVSNSTLHHNQRWILNYAPDIFIGGVGQSATGNEIYGSPQIAVFMQGNDHTLSKADIHDAARQCSDCGSFYMGRDWTYRGNSILSSKFSKLSSIWGAVSAV